MPIKSDVYPMQTVLGQDIAFLARLQNAVGGYITQAGLTSIKLTLLNPAGTKVIDAATVTISTAVYDTLQGTDGLDPRWTRDVDPQLVGFNFIYKIAGANFATRGFYRAEFTFTETTGSVWRLIYEGEARSSNT